MNTRSQVYVWAAQRISAMALAVCVLIHLGTLIYAVRGGLTAAEILGRTRGSLAWGIFYATFALMVSVHASIGLRAVLSESVGMRGAALDTTVLVVGLLIAGLGLRAVWAVVA